jgi:hypothetical protein
MRTRIFVKSAVTAVTALATLAALAGCGSSGTPGSQTLANAATKTAAAHTANVTIGLTSDSSPPVSFQGTGGTNFDLRQQHVTATKVVGIPGIPDGSSIELIIQLPLVYAHPLGAAAALALKGLGITQPWLKLDTRTLESLHGINFGPITAAKNVEPTQYLDFLQGATVVTKVGSDQVDGAATTHYRTTVDLNAAVKKTSGDAAVAINRDIASFQSPLIPVEVWIDGQGLVRKLTAALGLKATTSGAAFHAQLTFTFSGFGTPVDTSTPPVAQTADLAPLLSALAGGGKSG